MRFDRYYKGDFAETERKRAAIKRAQLKEVAALPLFAEDVRAAQPSVEFIMKDRSAKFATGLAIDRKRVADKWLCARYLLSRMSPADAKMLREYWQDCKWPGTPSYFLSMLDMFNRGDLPGLHSERIAA